MKIATKLFMLVEENVSFDTGDVSKQNSGNKNTVALLLKLTMALALP